MAHRINLIPGGAEHAPCVGDRLPEQQQHGMHLLEACLLAEGARFHDLAKIDV